MVKFGIIKEIFDKDKEGAELITSKGAHYRKIVIQDIQTKKDDWYSIFEGKLWKQMWEINKLKAGDHVRYEDEPQKNNPDFRNLTSCVLDTVKETSLPEPLNRGFNQTAEEMTASLLNAGLTQGEIDDRVAQKIKATGNLMDRTAALSILCNELNVPIPKQEYPEETITATKEQLMLKMNENNYKAMMLGHALKFIELQIAAGGFGDASNLTIDKVKQVAAELGK